MTTGPYQVAEVEDAENAACTCSDCGWTGTADATTDVQDCALTPGDPSPVGRCPECDSLAYLDRPLRAGSLDLRLLELVCDLEHYLGAIRDETLDGSEPALGRLLERSAALRREFAYRPPSERRHRSLNENSRLWLAIVEHVVVPGAKLKLVMQQAEPTPAEILPHFAGEVGDGESLDDLYLNGVFDVTHELQYRGNLQAFMEAAVQIEALEAEDEPPKVVLKLSYDGAAPSIVSNKPISVAILRGGKDLAGYDKEEIFEIRSKDLRSRNEEAFGHLKAPMIDAPWVGEIFSSFAHSDDPECRALIHTDGELRNHQSKEKETAKDDSLATFNYQLLARLQQDCEYYLGAGARNSKHLWALNEAEQIQKMKDLYAALPEKPVWLTLKDIEQYEAAMIGLKLEDEKPSGASTKM